MSDHNYATLLDENGRDVVADLFPAKRRYMQRQGGKVNENEIGADHVNELRKAVKASTPALPAEVRQTIDTLAKLPEGLGHARDREQTCKEAVRDARESLDLVLTNALLTANGALDGKNDTERKDRRAAYLATHAEYQAALTAVNKVESQLANASIDVKEMEDRLAVQRSIARLLAASLEYTTNV